MKTSKFAKNIFLIALFTTASTFTFSEEKKTSEPELYGNFHFHIEIAGATDGTTEQFFTVEISEGKDGTTEHFFTVEIFEGRIANTSSSGFSIRSRETRSKSGHIEYIVVSENSKYSFECIVLIDRGGNLVDVLTDEKV